MSLCVRGQRVIFGHRQQKSSSNKTHTFRLLCFSLETNQTRTTRGRYDNIKIKRKWCQETNISLWNNHVATSSFILRGQFFTYQYYEQNLWLYSIKFILLFNIIWCRTSAWREESNNFCIALADELCCETRPKKLTLRTCILHLHFLYDITYTNCPTIPCYTVRKFFIFRTAWCFDKKQSTYIQIDVFVTTVFPERFFN